MEQQLQELLDRKACEVVIMRYGRTSDWLDADGQKACFWPDEEVDYGFFQGSGEEWVPTVTAVEAASPHRWHLSTGVMVQVKGSRAKSECYGISVGATQDEQVESVDIMFGGRYLGEFRNEPILQIGPIAFTRV